MFQKVAYLGLDNHRKFSKLTGRDGSGRIVVRSRLDHRDRHRMRQTLRQFAPATPVVLESSFGWGWMADELQACGLSPHLCSSLKVAKWRQARGIAKSNRLDADLLSELWLERHRWWEVWLAPPEVRQEREWLRYRATLVQMQTEVKNRIHAILHRHGILHDFSDLFGGAGLKFLSELAGSPERLPESGRAMLEGYVRVLVRLRGQIAEVTADLRKRLGKDPLIRRLMTIPGIGWILAHLILAEVGRLDRFPSAKHLVSYSLLAPRADDSGEDDPQNPKGRHVGFIGRRTLKWAFIEAAHSAVMKSSRFALIFSRRTNGGQRDRNRGYIAVAGELARIAYVVWSKEVNYQESPPPRPGSRRQRRRRKAGISRPGTSQPEDAMVIAACQ